jgi:tryptophan synthase alpha subunit
MKACEASLKNGTKVRDAFILMKKLSAQVSIPLLFMGYYNTVFKYDVEKFCRDAKNAGASGLIIPDIPLDEEPEEGFIKFSTLNNLYPIRVISPASSDERLRKNAAVARGFVYCMARQGITGAKKDLDPGLVKYLNRVKKYFNVPLAVGFGISKSEHVAALKEHADVAIVGSAVIDLIGRSPYEEIEKNVAEFCREILEF